MSVKTKLILWVIPIVGLVYLFICIFKPNLWLDDSAVNNNITSIITGFMIQVSSIAVVAIILANLNLLP